MSEFVPSSTTVELSQADEDNRKDHVSASQLSKYRSCSRSWKYHYRDKRKSLPNENLLLGSAFHFGIEHNYRQKIISGTDRPLDEVEQVVVERLETDCKAPYIGPGVNKLAEVARGLIKTHHLKVAPSVQPAYVEMEFRINLGDQCPVDLVGFIDCITIDGIIIDNKSWNKEKYQYYADKDLQLTLYSFAYRMLFGKPEKSLRFDAVTKKGYKYAPLTTSRTNLDIRWTLRQLEDIISCMQAGTTFPNNEGALCSEKYCDYWDVCHEDLA